MSANMEKRYQYRGATGITWTKWFECDDSEERVQLKGRTTLLNEYRNNK
jgi:hypothetical protein